MNVIKMFAGLLVAEPIESMGQVDDSHNWHQYNAKTGKPMATSYLSGMAWTILPREAHRPAVALHWLCVAQTTGAGLAPNQLSKARQRVTPPAWAMSVFMDKPSCITSQYKGSHSPKA